MSKRIYTHLAAVILVIGLAMALQLHGQQQPRTADDAMTQKSMQEMNERGDRAMGFDHMKTTHHFILTNDGGVIQVEANKASDKESSDEIRGHLRHIAIMFSDGNFNTPMFIHAQNPPGVEVMKQLKAEIDYKFKQTKRGGRVLITSNNAEAIRAIHEFLSFQIREHKTGDRLEVVN